MKKKINLVWPQYIKNKSGKITHVYIPIEAYEKIEKDLKEWKRIQKEEGVRWVKLRARRVSKKPVVKAKK